MRLTKKDENGKFFSIAESKVFDEEQQCIDKLGQLEDIEEELGVDLVELLSKGDFLHLLFNYTHNIPFVFAPTKENDKK